MPVNNFMQKDDLSLSGESAGEEYEVDQILGVRVLQDGTKEYKVRWKNYGSNDDTWEPMDNLVGAKDALDKFLKANKQAKKTPKASRTPKATKLGRKRGGGDISQEAEDGENNRSSNEDESDDDFSVSSASKKKKTTNMPSEHDPTPANLSTVLNGGTISKFGSKESSISEHSKKSSRAKRNTRSNVGMYAKRSGQTPTTSKASEHHLKFDGIYFDKNGVLKLVEKGGTQRVFTFEEAKDKNSSALCDYMCDMVTFTEKGKPQIQVAPQEMETEEGHHEEEEEKVKEQTHADDGKLNFDE